MRSLIISIFLYACESRTLTAELEKRTQAFEMRCYWRLLNISYKDQVSNEEVRRKIRAAIGEYDKLLTLVKCAEKVKAMTVSPIRLITFTFILLELSPLTFYSYWITSLGMDLYQN